MYQIISGDSKYYVDNIVYIKLNDKNGCYVICDEQDAGGVCVKVPMEITNDDGTVVTTCMDTVFAIKEGGLRGTESLCRIEPAKIALDYFNAMMSAELLSMIEEVL